MLVFNVMSALSVAMKRGPHQLEPGPALIAVTLVVPDAVWSEVKALQSPLLRLVSL